MLHGNMANQPVFQDELQGGKATAETGPYHDKEVAIDRIWSRHSRQSKRKHNAPELGDPGGSSSGGGDAKTIVSFTQDDPENPYNWSSVCPSIL